VTGRRSRIGLNLLWMVPGVVGGSEEYTTRLLRAATERANADFELVLFVNSLVPEVYPELCSAHECHVAPVSGRRKSVRVLVEATWLAVQCRRLGIDLVHHLGGIMPFVRLTPGMVTVHDLQPLAMPEHFAPLKRGFSRLAIPRSVRAARRVVTLTQFTERDLVNRLGVDERTIIIVPSGTRFLDPVPELRQVPDVRSAYALGERPFFLFPAITYPHKNHLMLLTAFSLVHERHPEAALVLTGGSAQMEAQLLAEIAERGLDDSVYRLGRIPRDDLNSLFRTAVALTFPSRFEGFGLPVLEAMTRRCPVIAADATALPEVVGDAGLLLAPDDPEAWAKAMARMLEDPHERDRLAELGVERARVFDWPSAAERLELAWSAGLEER
jgi:glycosyltransferase involved in cell wall biosynthesis